MIFARAGKPPDLRGVHCALGLLAAALAAWACAGNGLEVPLPAVPPEGQLKPLDATTLLSRAIRYRTVNPPGDEAPLARFFAELARSAGLEARVIPTPSGESKAGRAAAWARLRGSAGAPPLVLLSHLDVVPAQPDDWGADPFAGVVEHGFVVGRGAQDAKGVAVVQLLALAELAQRERPPRRDVIFLATPDEETGGLDGAGWLLRRHRDLVGRSGYLLTEGGGILLSPDGTPAWHVAVTEKSPCWLRIETEGPPGHSSVPPREAAVPRLVAALDRVRRLETTVRVVPEVAQMFAALAPLAPEADRAGFADLSRGLGEDTAFRRRFLGEPRYAALVRDTVALTVLEGSSRTNVIAARASAHVDARLLPGSSCETFAKRIRRSVDSDGAEVEVLLSFGGNETSSQETPLYRAISAVAGRADARAVIVPRVLAGFTDAHWFRKMGLVAYGFVPRWHRVGETRGIHGPNERISVENLERGVSTLVAIIDELDRLEE